MFSFFTSVWNSGNEYQALFLSTSEPTNKDGSTRNRTKSICDPFVFNTVVSRARSVVVSAGNPFTLLRKESHTVKKYGDRAKCWSNYLKLCIENETISAAPSLGLSEEELLATKSIECVFGVTHKSLVRYFCFHCNKTLNCLYVEA